MKLRSAFKKLIPYIWGVFYRLDPQKSLKRLLSMWFILFALIPLFLIAIYTTFLFNHRINDELIKRLTAFEIGIELELVDVEGKLRLGAFRHANDYYFMNLLKLKRKTTLESVTENLIENFIIDRISYFTSKGTIFLSVIPKRIVNDPEFILPEEEKLLSTTLIAQLLEQRQVIVKRAYPNIGFSFDCYTVMKIGKKVLGFMKETIVIDRQYSVNTQERTGLEICLLDIGYHLLVSTLPPEKEQSFRYPFQEEDRFVNITIGTETYMMLTKPLLDDHEKSFGYFAILVSRSNAQKTLYEILTIFLFICTGITLMVIFFTKIASKTVLYPIDHLLKATRNIGRGELGQSIGIPRMQEIAELVNSFNEMSSSLFKMKRELEGKVEDLKSAQAQLIHSSKMVSLGQLVAGVAHELNNPIGYTHSNIHQLKEYMSHIHKLIKTYEKMASRLPKTEQNKISQLRKEINIDFLINDIDTIIKSSLEGTTRTKEIVTGLRNFSRLDEAEIKTVDLHEGLKNTLKLLNSEFKNKITLHKKFGKLPKILCYPSQINQVFMNILSNAVQAIEEKGDIWIATSVERDKIHISIKDSGKGIAQEHLSQIFDPFFTTKKVGQGTGLGLSISYGIIQKHHGEIKVESSPNEGATFTIILPTRGFEEPS